MKPETISKTLVNQMLLCFGVIFASQVEECGKWLVHWIFSSIFKLGMLECWWWPGFSYPRRVVGCSHFLEWWSSVWKLERSNHGMQPVSPIYALGCWLGSRCFLSSLIYSKHLVWSLSLWLWSHAFDQALLSLRPQPLGPEILGSAQAIFQVLTILAINVMIVIVVIVV